eukprot:Em0005g1144a
MESSPANNSWQNILGKILDKILWQDKILNFILPRILRLGIAKILVSRFLPSWSRFLPFLVKIPLTFLVKILTFIKAPDFLVNFLVKIPDFLVKIPDFLVKIPTFPGKIPTFLVKIPAFL